MSSDLEEYKKKLLKSRPRSQIAVDGLIIQDLCDDLLSCVEALEFIANHMRPPMHPRLVKQNARKCLTNLKLGSGK